MAPGRDRTFLRSAVGHATDCATGHGHIVCMGFVFGPCFSLCSYSLVAIIVLSLPHGVMGWSVTVAYSGHTHLLLTRPFLTLATGLDNQKFSAYNCEYFLTHYF